MKNYKTILIILFSLVCLISSYLIKNQADYICWVNSRFIKHSIGTSYGIKHTINFQILNPDRDKAFLEYALRLYNSIQLDSYYGFDKKNRKQLTTIADSLRITVNRYQSNTSIFKEIMDYILVCEARKDNTNIRILIYELEKIPNDSIKLSFYPFHDYKHIDHLEFVESNSVLTKKEILNHKGEMSNIEVHTFNPVTCETRAIKYKNR